MFTSLSNWVGNWIGKNSYSHLNLPNEYDIPPNENFLTPEELAYKEKYPNWQEGMPTGNSVKGGPIRDDAYWDEKFSLSNYWFGNNNNNNEDNYLLAGGFLLITYFCLK